MVEMARGARKSRGRMTSACSVPVELRSWTVLAIDCSSRLAASSVVPRLRRPYGVPVLDSGAGIHMSGAVIDSSSSCRGLIGNAKSRGMTPTIVYGFPS